MQVITFYPGRERGGGRTAVTAPLERQLGEVPGLNQMLSTSSEGASVITLQFALSLNIDVAEQDVQEAINAAQNYPSGAAADAAGLQQGQSGRCADTDARPDARIRCPFRRSRITRTRAWREKISQLAGGRRGDDQRRPEAGGAGPGESDPARLLRPQSGETSAPRSSPTSLDAAKGSFDGPSQSYQIGANDQITTSGGISEAGDRLPRRRAGHAEGRGQCRRRDGERPAVRLDEHGAGRDREHPAAAGRQHHRGRGRIKALLPKLRATIPPGIKIAVLTDRTTTVRASVADVEFELVLCIALVVAVIFVFLRTFAATVIPSIAVPLSLVGTFGGDVRARLQPEQPDADGADDIHRLRRRRCDRHDREHHALRGAGGGAAGRRPQGRGADRLHDHVADGFADCGTHPAAVHGRHHGPAVPGIRDHA